MKKSSKLISKKNNNILLRLGIGAFFLTNSIAAWQGGDEFKEIISKHTWITNIVSANALVKVIGVNDALVFLVLVSGLFRKYVAIWGILWLVSVIYMISFAVPDLFEHLGIMLLLAYYFQTDNQ